MIAFVAGAMIWVGLILAFGGPVYFVIAGLAVLLVALALLVHAVNQADRRLKSELEPTPLGHHRVGTPGSLRMSASTRARERGWEI
jgi:membrane protein implicated in regulation of membrane protease activity